MMVRLLESCDGTLTYVEEAVVQATDTQRRRTVRVTAHKSYLARR